jgi:hypothetical protein
MFEVTPGQLSSGNDSTDALGADRTEMTRGARHHERAGACFVTQSSSLRRSCYVGLLVTALVAL